MELTLNEVEHMTRLARMRLSADEMERMREQLSAILDYIALLNEVDVSDVPPTAQVTGLSSVMREDTVLPSLPRNEVLAQSPDHAEGMFRVKAVFDD
ncbi:MAG: Asp-tRNA(Asn)/Glu-tRNA(Gln) amidotransferase subunit GatC [Chloroflexaceae bacterium]|nr:Asp-tRNA(Asn)/Glu-tRNA(Gln) amidotransferase subunit GatC [Chloroflexaceae bacterium]